MGGNSGRSYLDVPLHVLDEFDVAWAGKAGRYDDRVLLAHDRRDLTRNAKIEPSKKKGSTRPVEFCQLADPVAMIINNVLSQGRVRTAMTASRHAAHFAVLVVTQPRFLGKVAGNEHLIDGAIVKRFECVV